MARLFDALLDSTVVDKKKEKEKEKKKKKRTVEILPFIIQQYSLYTGKHDDNDYDSELE